jgi:hypothetical protein
VAAPRTLPASSAKDLFKDIDVSCQKKLGWAML